MFSSSVHLSLLLFVVAWLLVGAVGVCVRCLFVSLLFNGVFCLLLVACCCCYVIVVMLLLPLLLLLLACTFTD